MVKGSGSRRRPDASHGFDLGSGETSSPGGVPIYIIIGEISPKREIKKNKLRTRN